MYCLVDLDKQNKYLFSRLKRTVYIEDYDRLGDDHSVLGVGATFLGEPVGYIIARMYDRHAWNIDLLYVLPRYRKMGIASSLINRVTQLVLQQEGKAVRFSYEDVSPFAGQIEKLLARCGFPAPAPDINFYHNSIEKLCSLKWVRKYALAGLLEKKTVFYRDYEIFHWSELNQEDMEFLKSGEGGVFPRDVSPLPVLHLIDGSISLGVRHKGGLIGWLVTVRDGSEIQYVKASFLKEEYRGTSLYLVLFSTVMNLQRNAGIPYTTTEVRVDNRNMIRFMDHALLESECKKTVTLAAIRFLAAP